MSLSMFIYINSVVRDLLESLYPVLWFILAPQDHCKTRPEGLSDHIRLVSSLLGGRTWWKLLFLVTLVGL